jgi:hypothetical protein
VSTLITFAIYAALATGALFAIHTAWDGFKDRIGQPYAAAQLKQDETVVASITKDRDQWKAEEQKREAENADLAKKVAEQNTTIEDVTTKYLDSLHRTADILAMQKAARTVRITEHEADKGIVLSPQPAKPADEEIKAIDSAVMDALGLKKVAK